MIFQSCCCFLKRSKASFAVFWSLCLASVWNIGTAKVQIFFCYRSVYRCVHSLHKLISSNTWTILGKVEPAPSNWCTGAMCLSWSLVTCWPATTMPGELRFDDLHNFIFSGVLKTYIYIHIYICVFQMDGNSMMFYHGLRVISRCPTFLSVNWGRCYKA